MSWLIGVIGRILNPQTVLDSGNELENGRRQADRVLFSNRKIVIKFLHKYNEVKLANANPERGVSRLREVTLPQAGLSAVLEEFPWQLTVSGKPSM